MTEQTQALKPRAFWADTRARTLRRGRFWIAGERVTRLAGQPIAVVTGDTSAFAPASLPILAAPKAGGAAAEPLRLPEHGVTINGHGLIYEKNSDAALKPVLDWLERHAGATSMQGEQ